MSQNYLPETRKVSIFWRGRAITDNILDNTLQDKISITFPFIFMKVKWQFSKLQMTLYLTLNTWWAKQQKSHLYKRC